jgi:hypothetical protein
MSPEPEPLGIADASCMLFRDGPAWNGQSCAAIGKVRFASSEAGAALLTHALKLLAGEGRHAIVGPMDGDTWHAYRAVTENDKSPPFLMEPVSAPHDAEAFLRAGFVQVSQYMSARALLGDAVGTADPFIVPGVTIDAWNGGDPEGLIAQLFALSSASFAGNAFYKPINSATFLALYRPVMAAVDPRLVLFARNDRGELVGFLFGMPDHLEGPKPATVILKTYASALKGVGRALADSFHRRALSLGYGSVIHALMHETNMSRASSALFKAHVFRRYTLFGRKTGA